MSERTIPCVMMVLLLLLHPSVCAAVDGPVRTACDLGLLFDGAQSLDEDMPMPRALWGLLLYEAFGYSLGSISADTDLRDMPKGGEGDRLGKVCNAGWLARSRHCGLQPMGAMRHQEALSSLEMVRSSLAGTGGSIPTGRCQTAKDVVQPDGSTLDRDYLRLGQGLGMVIGELALIQPASEPNSPVPTVRSYYSLLGMVLSGAEHGLVRLAEHCCGAALRNSVRNVSKVPAGTQYRLVSLDIADMTVAGHLASVDIKRMADLKVDGSVSRSEAIDTLQLRLRPYGWSIYR